MTAGEAGRRRLRTLRHRLHSGDSATIQGAMVASRCDPLKDGWVVAVWLIGAIAPLARRMADGARRCDPLLLTIEAMAAERRGVDCVALSWVLAHDDIEIADAVLEAAIAAAGAIFGSLTDDELAAITAMTEILEPEVAR